MARSGAQADARATALMVLGVDKGAALARQRGLDALFLLRDDEGRTSGVSVGRLSCQKPAATPFAEEG
ncbi:hypothetical protein [Paracoccus salsus]|uniref:hypothetical protein n=1 Tax=Paracoccus salsus TaxID=2911061 RepID=UPI003F6E2A8A